MLTKRGLLLVVSLLGPTLALVACNGGGSEAGGTPTATNVTLSGTAATGAALSGAAINIKCAAGTVSGAAGANGAFSLSVPNGMLPCMLQATSADGKTVLYSVAEGTGAGATTANVTPLTDLIVATALGAGATPADTFENYNSSTSGAMTSESLLNAKAAVKAALSAVISVTSDPLTVAFSVGDATDKQLDTLIATLITAQTTLEQLENAVITSQSGGSEPSSAVTAVLNPPPIGGVCASLRSGTYITVDQLGRVDTHQWELAAAGGTATETDGSTTTFALIDDGRCHISGTFANGTVADVVFNTSEVFGTYRLSKNGYPYAWIGLVFPSQLITQAALAGKWNAAVFDRTSSTDLPQFGAGAIDIADDGTYTWKTCASDGHGVYDCNGSTAADATGKLTVGSNGRVTAADGTVYYPFRSTKGAIALMAGKSNALGIRILTQQKALSLPSVGKASNSWNLNGSVSASFTAGFTAKAGSAKAATVTTVDTANNSFSFDDGRTIRINDPLKGLRYMPAGTDTSGSYESRLQMRVGGFLTVFGNEKAAGDISASFGLSLDQ